MHQHPEAAGRTKMEKSSNSHEEQHLMRFLLAQPHVYSCVIRQLIIVITHRSN